MKIISLQIEDNLYTALIALIQQLPPDKVKLNTSPSFSTRDFAALFASLDHFPADFMIKGREQPLMQEREWH